MRGRLCANFLRVDKLDPILSYGIVDGILHERAGVRYTPQPFEIGLVLGEEKFFGVFAMEFVAAKHIMARFDYLSCGCTQDWLASITAPAPGITKPNRWQEMQRRRFGPAICRCGANQKIFWRCFGISDLDVEVALLRQSIGVPEFEFWLRS